jgi:hypothetical protein
MFIFALARALDQASVPYAIVGGYAVALHGLVRGTIDVDLVLKFERGHFLKADKALRGMGLEPRLPVEAGQVFDFREEYVENRNLVAWSFYNPRKPIEVVDILLTEDLSRVKVERIRAGDAVLKVASIDDLIRMKTASGRPQDLEDVKGLKELKK